MNLNKPTIKPNTEEVKDFFDVINYCDSNSSFDSIEEK
jgi:maternal embryonic leucine zipper kinase